MNPDDDPYLSLRGWLLVAVIAAVIFLAFGCATKPPELSNRPNECFISGGLHWIITDDPDSLCRLYGYRGKLQVVGCQMTKRDGTKVIITGPMQDRNDVETFLHEMNHACFGEFHDHQETGTRELFGKGGIRG